MKILKKTAALLLIGAMVLSVAACQPSGPAVDDTSSVDPGIKVPVGGGTVKDGKMAYTLSADVAAIHGKYWQEKHNGVDTYTFSHGAAGIDVDFTGTDFYIYIPEVPMDGDKVREVGISVLIDSEMPMDATMTAPKEAGWMQVASGLADGEHHIRIRKQSRGFYGIMASDWFCVSEIATNETGTVMTPDRISDLVIEVYGDSISNGDAVWYNEDGSNSAYTNGNWTGVLERLLGAEVKVTANTGNGLLGWVFPQKNGKADNLLPPQNNWDVIDPNHNGGTYSHEGANAADVVIINLGTNDRGDYGNGDITLKSFSEEYLRFIKQIKTDCPDAIVICTIGAMGGVTEWGEMLGGAGFDYINYEWQDGSFTENGKTQPIMRQIAEGAKMNQFLRTLPDDQKPEVIHCKSVVDQANEWAGSTFCYYVEIQKCDTIGKNELVNTKKDGKATDIPAGAGYDNGHPSNLAGEIYGLQYATLINKVLNLGIELPTDIPAYTFEKRTGRTAPEGNLIEYLTERTNTLSYIDEVISKAQNGTAN